VRVGFDQNSTESEVFGVRVKTNQVATIQVINIFMLVCLVLLFFISLFISGMRNKSNGLGDEVIKML